MRLHLIGCKDVAWVAYKHIVGSTPCKSVYYQACPAGHALKMTHQQSVHVLGELSVVSK